MSPRKKKTGEGTQFLQCVHCSTYLLSQPSVMKHSCRNSGLNQNKRHATIQKATATRSVKISYVRVALKRLPLDSIPLKCVSVIKKRGRGRPKGKTFLDTGDSDSASPKQNCKAFNNDETEKRLTSEPILKKTRKTRINGVSKVLKNLGVDNLDAVEKLTRTPRRCNIATKEKLESHYKNNETDKNGEDETNNAPGKIPKIARKIGRPRKNRTDCDGSGDEDKVQKKRNYYPGKEKRVMDIFYNNKCSKCPGKFRAEKEYILHMKTVHESGRKTLACPVCAREFIKRHHLRIHIDRHISAESVEKTLNLMETWPKRRDETQSFSCKFCLVRHPHQHSFLTHMKEQHSDQMKNLEFSCPHSCEVKTNSVKGLIDHVKSQHQTQFYGRNTLRKIAPDLSEIGKYKDKNGKSKSLSKCDICGKTLVSYYMKLHKETHEKILEKAKECKFQCPICSRGFKDRYKLRKHFMLHLENNPYVCRFGGCGLKFQDEYYLARHVELHYDDGPKHTCDKCGVTYRSNISTRGSHKCVTDPRKIKIGADGRKYTTNRPLKVKRVSTELGTLDLDLQPRESERSNGDLPAAPNDEYLQEKMEVASVHFVDKIIETEDGPIHLKGERLSPEKELISVPNDDNVLTHSQQIPAEKQKNLSIPAHENTLIIILQDPVYQRLVKENPEFETIIKGVGKPYNQDKLFRCSLCSCAFLRYWSLDQHMKARHANRESNNKTATNNVGQDSSSSDTHQQVVKLMCGTCGFHASNGEALEHHMKTAKNHGSTFNHRCTFGKCGVPFETSELLASHVQRVHLSDTHKLKFKCGKCGTMFLNATTLRKHKTKYHAKNKPAAENERKKTWKCMQCDKAFVDKVMLQKHKKLHQRASVYKLCRMKCEICGDVLSTRHTLKRHIRRVHLNYNGTYQSKSSKATNNPNPPGTVVTPVGVGSGESESHNGGNATDKSNENEILGL